MGRKYKTPYIHDHFRGENIQKKSFHDHFPFFSFFLGGGGGRKEKDRVMGRNKVLTFLLKKTAVKMTGCLARFRSKGSLLICEIRNNRPRACIS